jgi:hypothetical protein
MLCQLVCVDRRYQRMNCFNIRELQGSLKRKFFADLVNSQTSHSSLNESMIGLRFKLGANNFIDQNVTSMFNFSPADFSDFRAMVFTSPLQTSSSLPFSSAFTKSNLLSEASLSESSNSLRSQRFVNSLINYDYKTGHYLGS